jgi:hypothetical protein
MNQIISDDDNNVKPEDCVLVFGINIPTCEEAFNKLQHKPAKKGEIFVKHYRQWEWEKYYYEFLNPFQVTIPRIKDLGVTIVPDFRTQLSFGDKLRRFIGGKNTNTHPLITWNDDLNLDALKDIFQSNKYKVIILFSHWTENVIERDKDKSIIYDAVEFPDGFITIPKIIEQIPSHLTGVIDLCVCHPKPLVTALRLHCPNCLVKYIDKPATPAYWMYFYLALFRYLKSNPSNYSVALDKIIEGFLNRRISKLTKK